MIWNLKQIVPHFYKLFRNCLTNCESTGVCNTQCLEAYQSEIRRCPCAADCPNGCPCDNGYEGCPAKTGLSIIGDSYFVLERVSLFVNNDDSVSKPTWEIPDRFVYDSGTALLKGQQFILGGLTNLTQIAILKDCAVEMQSQKLEIGFSQHYGDMTVLNEKSKFVPNFHMFFIFIFLGYLCFSTSVSKWARCETFDGETVEVIEGRSDYGHYFGSLGHFENELYAFGGWNYSNTQTRKCSVLIEVFWYRRDPLICGPLICGFWLDPEKFSNIVKNYDKLNGKKILSFWVE